MVKVRPPRSVPFSATIALSASLALVISTNAKPRARPVSRSVMILIFSTAPCTSNAVRSSASVMLWGKLPTYKFFIAFPLLVIHLGSAIQEPAWTAGFQNPVAARVSPVSPLNERKTRTGPRRFAARLPEFPTAGAEFQKHRLTAFPSALSGGSGRYPAGLRRLPPHLARQRGTQVCLPETQAAGVAWRGAGLHKTCHDGPVYFPH